jgi:hypothetical protein
MRTRFLDPIGPSHPAWNHFDNALEAYQGIKKKSMRDHHYHPFQNEAYAMRMSLRKEGASESLILEWDASLKQQCKLIETQP